MTIDLKHITVAFDYTSGDIADIKRCLECLYQTAEGTCPLDREFGLNTDFVGMPMDVAKEPVRSGDHRQDGPVRAKGNSKRYQLLIQ